MKADDITKMMYFDITIDGELYALGWYGDCGWYGSLSEKEISGIRVRKGNILIGDNKTLNGIFREARFNGWTQGELFIITDKLIPNARRDDFEQNQYYFQLLDALREGVGLDITHAIREASLSRNDASAKAMREVAKKLNEADTILEEGFNSSVDKDKLLTELTAAAEALEKVKPKDGEQQAQQEQLRERIATTVDAVATSKKYKLNEVNSGIDKKSKKVLAIVSDILSTKLSKFLVDEIIEEIINKLNGK
jgi:molecular chaperone HtpG